MVTRDANIVIGGDAELIHILEGDGQKTKIIPSAIENNELGKKGLFQIKGKGRNTYYVFKTLGD